MPYIRKTRDEYQVHGPATRTGWEEVCAADTRIEARKRLREYRGAEPAIEFRIVKRRTRLAGGEVSNG